MSAPQIIKTEGGDELVVLSRRDYDVLLARAGVEAAEDAMSERIIAETDGEVALPEGVWEEIEGGSHPIAAIRFWRGMTQEALSDACGLAQSYLSAIENRRKQPTTAALAAIAKALRVKLSQIIEG